jgi:hypothetical protein
VTGFFFTDCGGGCTAAPLFAVACSADADDDPTVAAANPASRPPTT